MPICSIEDIDDEIRRLTLDAGEIVELRFEEDSVAIYAEGNEVGRLGFRAYEVPVYDYEETCYHLTHAFIEGDGGKYKNQGIGTEAFRLFRECTGAKVTFSEHDGLQKDDGSHLTGDAPHFVASLKAPRWLVVKFDVSAGTTSLRRRCLWSPPSLPANARSLLINQLLHS